MRNRKLMRWFLMTVFIFLCSFPVSADTQSDFLDALSRGLNTRWSYNEQMADKEASMTEDEHREYFGKLAQLELTEVEPFYNKEFEDEQFAALVRTYIEGVRMQKETARSGEYLSTLYDIGWTYGYRIRALTIVYFCDQYGLEIDEENLDEFREATSFWNLYEIESITVDTPTPTPKPTKKPTTAPDPKTTEETGDASNTKAGEDSAATSDSAGMNESADVSNTKTGEDSAATSDSVGKKKPVATPAPKSTEEQEYEIPEGAYDLTDVLKKRKGPETIRSLYYEYCETMNHKEGVRVYFEYINKSKEGNMCINTFHYQVYSDDIGIYNTLSTDSVKSRNVEGADWNMVKNGRPNVFAWVFEFDDDADTIEMQLIDSTWKNPSRMITFYREGVGTFELSE